MKKLVGFDYPIQHSISMPATINGWAGECLACRFAFKRLPVAAGAGRSGELSGFQTVFQDLVEIVSVGFLGALDHVDNP